MAGKKRAQKWKYKVNNKLRDFGETDFGKKTITINRTLHKKAKNGKVSHGHAKKDLTLINTIVHERLHVKNPRMRERAVRKKAAGAVARMGVVAKKRAYRLFQYPKRGRRAF